MLLQFIPSHLIALGFEVSVCFEFPLPFPLTKATPLFCFPLPTNTQTQAREREQTRERGKQKQKKKKRFVSKISSLPIILLIMTAWITNAPGGLSDTANQPGYKSPKKWARHPSPASTLCMDKHEMAIIATRPVCSSRSREWNVLRFSIAFSCGLKYPSPVGEWVGKGTGGERGLVTRPDMGYGLDKGASLYHLRGYNI